MNEASGRRRRWTGAVALVAAVLTLVGAELFLRGRVSPVLVLLAYALCLLFVLIAVVIALADARVVARRGIEERRNLLNQALGDIELEARRRKRNPPKNE